MPLQSRDEQRGRHTLTAEDRRRGGLRYAGGVSMRELRIRRRVKPVPEDQ